MRHKPHAPLSAFFKDKTKPVSASWHFRPKKVLDVLLENRIWKCVREFVFDKHNFATYGGLGKLAFLNEML